MKFKLTILFISFFLIVSCVTNNTLEPEQKSKHTRAAEVLASNNVYVIIKNIPFAEKSWIPQNVKSECTEIGNQFSNSIVKYANRNGITIIQQDELLTVEKNIVVLNIQSVYSAGNAFIGHRKSVTVQAKLLVEGEEIATNSFTRNSSGGFMGGFKGSCSVLAHTVNTLGNDVGKWLSRQ